MSLYNRRIFLLGLLPLAACGFTPVYGTGSAADDILGNVEVEVKNSRNAFEFRDRLIERLGFADRSAPYLLTHEITITDDDLVINDTDNITRYTLSGRVDYQILDRRTGQIVFTDTVRSNTAYSATSGTFQTTVAERDANVRLVRDLAEKIVTRMSITSREWVK